MPAHIPGAVFFDIDAIADHSTDLPHMLPDADAFAAAAGALGLSESDTIVVYDGMGLFSAPRVWWTLKVFGAKDVRVLDGGFPAWKRAGFPIEAGEAKPKPAHFNPQFSRRDGAKLRPGARAPRCAGTLRSSTRARPPRFRGEAPEPRPGLASGHMPGAQNLPYDKLADDQGRLRPPDEIRKLFQERRRRPLVSRRDHLRLRR